MVDLTIRRMLLAENLLVHLEGLFKQGKGIFEITSLHIATEMDWLLASQYVFELTFLRGSEYESDTAS